MANKTCKCRFCDTIFNNPDAYTSHIEKVHSDLLIPDMSPAQSLYYQSTGKKNGKCVICGKPTDWNDITLKYHRFCNNPKCKEKYIEQFKTRMIGKYGKVTLLDDPEHQKKMLANRSISGKYRWSDGITETSYTGSYELAFLEYLDLVMDFSPDDVIAPSPHTYYYVYEGKKRFYIPDFYIPSLNLEIEIKDGGDNPNKHGKIQAVDKVKEKLKDDVMRSNKNHFNYLKIENKEHNRFFNYLMTAKFNTMNDIEENIVMI